jgi:hypothetical protein
MWREGYQTGPRVQPDVARQVTRCDKGVIRCGQWLQVEPRVTVLAAARGKSCAQGMQYLGGQKLKYEVMGCQMWPVVSSCDLDSGF